MITVDALLTAIGERCGLDAGQIGERTLRKEIDRAIAACPEPATLLDPDSPAWLALLHSLLIPETWFFRNLEAFDAFVAWARDVWLPAHSTPLRVLSLPCATGEEAYSIGMALLEAGIDPCRFQIQAGDIGAAFLETAVQAIYGRSSFRSSFPAERFHRFFESLSDGRRRVIPEVRSLVRFEVLNLVADELPPADAVFCRNVLIYFGETWQRIALQRLDAALSADGALFLGPVEPPLALRNGFVSLAYPMAFACRKALGAALPAPPPARRTRPAPAASRRSAAVAAASRTAVRPPPEPAAPPPQFASERLETVRELADRGQIVEAAEMLDRLAAADNNPSAELLCLRGVVQEALGQPGAAEPFYRQALFLEPDHTESLIHLCLLLELDGRSAAARVIRQRIHRQMVS